MKRLIKSQQNFGGYFDCGKKVKEKEELEKKQLEEGFWDNKELRESVFSKLSNINAILENIISYKGDTKNALDLIELLSLEPDNELEETLIKDYDKLKEEVEQFEIYLIVSMMLILVLLIFIQELVEQKLVTGQKCYIECI